MFKKDNVSKIIALLLGTTAVVGCSSNNDQQKQISASLVDASEKMSIFVRQTTPPNFAQVNATGGEGLSGSAWLDYDNDGDLDVFHTNGTGFSNRLLENRDGVFVDVTVQANLVNSAGSSAVVAGDIDNDGDVDLFTSGEGFVGFSQQTPTALYRNNGDGTFSDVTATANVPGAETALSAALGDIDGDGDLDLFVTGPGHLDAAPLINPALPSGFYGGTRQQHDNRLYLNNGDLTFTDITASSGIGAGLGACAVSFHDYEKDGDQDIYIANCNDVQFRPTPIQLMRNNGDNTFTDISATAGIDHGGFWMSLAFADIDNDGDDDLFATNFSGSPRFPDPSSGPFFNNRQHALYLNNGDGTYSDIAEENGIAFLEFGWGSVFADVNNDGYQDLFFTGSLPILGVSGQFANPGYLFLNNQKGGFIQASQEQSGGSLRHLVTSGVSKADYNADGRVDILVKTERLVNPENGQVIGSGNAVLLENRSVAGNSLTIKLRPANGQATAVGARIEVTTGSMTQAQNIYAGSSFASSESPWPTFGLAEYQNAEVVVVWPDGVRESFATQQYGVQTLTQGQGSVVTN